MQRRSIGRLVISGVLAQTGLALPALAQPQSDLRLALVIGNAAYPGDAALGNPINDALAMAETLRQLGFQVIEVRDATRSQMTEAIAAARAALQGRNGVGLLYYAGHGLQLEWRNYMVPVDAKIASSADIRSQGVDVNLVVDAFTAAGCRMNIVVLDACRDNPFATTASGKGLAQLDAPPGTFLAFATAPGNVAIDGDARSGNALYTGFLLEELKKPAARIEDVFKRVRLNVRKQSKGRQIPWESTSLEDDFVFNAGVQVRVPTRDERAREEAFRIEKADWDRIADSKNADDFYAFLLKYPNGAIAQNATAALERLAVAQTVAVADRNGIVQRPGAARFRVGDFAAVVRKDLYTGLEIGRGRSRVTRIHDGIVELDNGAVLLTLDGGSIKNQFVQLWDPPRMDYPGDDFAVGKRWTGRNIETALNGTKTWREDTVRITALEDVSVAAGKFKAFKFEMESVTGTGTFIRLTYWALPEWPVRVKALREIRPSRGVATREVIELVSYGRGSA
jgi:Caspase domain